MGKIQRKYKKKSQKLTNFTLKWYWMRCDVPHDRNTNTPAGDRRWRCPSRSDSRCTISYLVFLRPGTVWCWVLGSIPGEAKPNPVLNPKPSTTPYRVSKRLGNEFTPPMTIPGLKVCNEFITSKTFLLEFANYKTFINNKTFVGPLTRMAGKRDVMTCALSLVWRHSNITATSSSLLLRECKIAAEMLF